MVASRLKIVILLVEDEPIIRMGVADHLESIGYKVVEAGNGGQAIRILSERRDVHVLVTDIHMPGEINGIDLALWTRDNIPSTKIMVMSGAQSDAPRLRPLGDEGYIYSKPISNASLTKRIRELVEK